MAARSIVGTNIGKFSLVLMLTGTADAKKKLWVLGETRGAIPPLLKMKTHHRSKTNRRLLRQSGKILSEEKKSAAGACRRARKHTNDPLMQEALREFQRRIADTYEELCSIGLSFR